MRGPGCDFPGADEKLPPEDRVLLRLHPYLGIQHPQYQEGVHGGKFRSQKLRYHVTSDGSLWALEEVSHFLI